MISCDLISFYSSKKPAESHNYYKNLLAQRNHTWFNMRIMAELLEGVSFSTDMRRPDIAPTPSPYTLYDPSERAGITMQALSDLGATFVYPGANEAQIVVAYSLLHARLLAEAPERTDNPEPFVGYTLTKDFGLGALVHAFDARASQPKTDVYRKLWEQYTPAQLNARYTEESKVRTSQQPAKFMPLVMLRGAGNGIDDNGLYFADQIVKDQITSVGNRPLLNPADQIMLNAQRRVTGDYLLSRSGLNRFVQLDRKTADARSCRPFAHASLTQVRLDGADGVRYFFGGVRLLGGVEKA